MTGEPVLTIVGNLAGEGFRLPPLPGREVEFSMKYSSSYG